MGSSNGTLSLSGLEREDEVQNAICEMVHVRHDLMAHTSASWSSDSLSTDHYSVHYNGNAVGPGAVNTNHVVTLNAPFV